MFRLFDIIISVSLFICGTVINESAGFGLLVVYGLLTLIPGLAVAVRRLHDTNHSGWWLLMSLIPFANIVLLIFFFLKGTTGDNNYGEDPKKLS